LRQLARRLEHARAWLQQASVLVVAGVSEGSARTAAEIARAVRLPAVCILNRALPPSLHGSDDAAARPFLAYVERYRGLQARVAAALAQVFPRVIELPECARTDLDGLTALGAQLSTAVSDGAAWGTAASTSSRRRAR
jgi:hypothetical protein